MQAGTGRINDPWGARRRGRRRLGSSRYTGRERVQTNLHRGFGAWAIAASSLASSGASWSSTA